MTFFRRCCRQSWATQYYHDVYDDVVCIAVHASNREEADRCLCEEFPEGGHIYRICEPWESSYQPGSDTPGEGRRLQPYQQSQIELCPSTKISCRGKYFLFSGVMGNREYGLTVAHATTPGDDIELDSDHDSLACNKTIGWCAESYENLQRQSGEPLSADIALLMLNTVRFAVDNTVRWPYPAGRTLQIKIYKELNIPKDRRVMILDRNGDFKYGNFFRTHFTDRSPANKNLFDVLAISTKKGQNEVPITQPGDSGALVMSLPNDDNDLIYVYGISSGIYDERMTIANSLSDVIHELYTNDKYQTALHNNSLYDDVDFALSQ